CTRYGCSIYPLAPMRFYFMGILLSIDDSRLEIDLHAPAYVVENEFPDERHSKYCHFFAILYSFVAASDRIDYFPTIRIFCNDLYHSDRLFYVCDVLFSLFTFAD